MYGTRQTKAVHTLDWRVKIVNPRKIPNVISLFFIINRLWVNSDIEDVQSLQHDHIVDEGCRNTEGERLQ